MLTVASPRLDEVQVSLRADQVRVAIERLRAGAKPGRRATLVYNFPPSISAASATRPAALLYLEQAVQDGVFRDARLLEGPQFVGVDGVTDLDDARLIAHIQRFVDGAAPGLRVPPRCLARRGGPRPGRDPRPTAGGVGG